MKEIEEDFVAWVEEHAKQEDHDPHCPFSKENKDERGTSVSSGAVSNAYRTGWEGIFGKTTVGDA